MKTITVDQVLNTIFGEAQGSAEGRVRSEDRIPVIQQTTGKSSRIQNPKGFLARAFSKLGLNQDASVDATAAPALKTMKQATRDLKALGLSKEIVESIKVNVQDVFCEIYRQSLISTALNTNTIMFASLEGEDMNRPFGVKVSNDDLITDKLIADVRAKFKDALEEYLRANPDYLNVPETPFEYRR